MRIQFKLHENFEGESDLLVHTDARIFEGASLNRIRNLDGVSWASSGFPPEAGAYSLSIHKSIFASWDEIQEGVRKILSEATLTDLMRSKP